MTCKELSNLIIQNHDSIAFLVGNGIHNYEISFKGVKEKLSWNGLLEKIKSGHGVSSLGEKPKEGITNTEYFDLIELLYIQQQIDKEKNGFSKSLKLDIDSLKILKHQNLNYLTHLDGVWAEKGSTASNPTLFLKNESLLKAESEINEKILSILDDFGFPHEKDTATYDQQAFAYDLLMGSDRKYYLIKRDVKRLFTDYYLQDWIKPFLLFARSVNAPIMTTNYDESLSNILCLPIKCSTDLNPQYNFPFETYFSDIIIEKSWNNFGIWHINGLIRYPQSIRIGYIDYAKMLNEIENRLFKRASTTNLDKSWISIFFHCNIFIFGLALETDEFVLRWLMVERARYSIINGLNLKGWYVHLSDVEGPMSDGKMMFLKMVGCEIIEVDSKVVYEDVWLQILKH